MVCVLEDKFTVHCLVYNAAVACNMFKLSKIEIILTPDHCMSAVFLHKRKLLKQ